MIHIKEFVISREEPTDTTVGWLKPIEDGKYSIYFYGSKGWCSVVDETSGGGGSGSGIEDIEVEATSPLNLEATISGALATITGSINQVDSDHFYGYVGCSTFVKDWEETGWVDPNTFKDEWLLSSIHNIKADFLYPVVEAYDSNFGDPNEPTGDKGLKAMLPYPAPENIVTTNNINNIEYVLCVTSEGYLRRVPVSLFTQE